MTSIQGLALLTTATATTFALAATACDPRGGAAKPRPAHPAAPAEPLEMTAEISSVVGGNTGFALDLYGQLRGDGDTNLFYSPYSISSALGMTYAGARGDTATEMASALHFDLPQGQLHPAMGSLVQHLNSPGADRGYALSVANRIWPKEGLQMVDSFLDVIGNDYGADILPLDFGATEDARLTINQWVEDQTEDRIKDLIKAGVLTPTTAMVLTNAIYFKGDWASQFKESDTRPAPFRRPGGEDSEAQMMFQTGEFRFAEVGDAQLLEMPYNTGALSMVVILPKAVDGLAAIEDELTSENLVGWMGELAPQEVEVTIPKFKMTSEFLLNDPLKALGMRAAFGSADFSGMTEGGGLFISHVIHKAFVEVNEQGTEAAAATAVVLTESARLIPQFRADHPFVFLIRDNQSGSILFVGRVVEP